MLNLDIRKNLGLDPSQHRSSNDNHEDSRVEREKKRNKLKNESPFEKLNTLKLLYNCGHLLEEEYKERKNQIINEMTGTSSNISNSTSHSTYV